MFQVWLGHCTLADADHAVSEPRAGPLALLSNQPHLMGPEL
jgi:hypothetical protein